MSNTVRPPSGTALRIPDGRAVPPPAPAGGGHTSLLGPLLVGLDAAVTAAVVVAVLVLRELVGRSWVDVGAPVLVLALPALTLAGTTAAGLYQRRKCAIASVEISRLGRTVAGVAVALLLVLQAADSIAPYTTTAIAAVLLFLGLVLGRGWYRHWVKRARRSGRFLTEVAVVGDTMTAQRFAERLLANPDAGYLPVAHVDIASDRTRPGVPDVVPRVAHVDDDLDRLIAEGVDSAVLVTTYLEPNDLNSVVRSLQRRFDHVQVVTALAGVSHARLHPTPLIDETTFYLEPVVASRWQRAVKRAMDVVLSALLLLLLSPVLAVAAAAIKLADGGPVFFAQERVGRGGRPITTRKLRSMAIDADVRFDEVARENDRVGPLYKSSRDPRITRVGRVLRATSLDELPQLWSILVGDMSLVGPRPALPAEVEAFDATHRRRHEVRPGLTGLWQVEDRDHPDFERYRRHDVFYIENWSLSLDVAILLQTAATVVARGLRMSADDRGVGL